MQRPIPAHSPFHPDPVRVVEFERGATASARAEPGSLGAAGARALFAMLYYLHTSLRAAASWLTRVAYFQPMFRARCAAVGRGLDVYLGIPAISPGLTLRVGDGLKLNAHSRLRCRAGEGTFTIGDHCAIGYDVSVLVSTSVRLGDRVRIADRVVVGGTSAPGSAPGARLTICDDVWIGTGATIGDGVTIGQAAIVAAGAVVTEDVAPRTVVAGNPARIVRVLPGEEGP